jgi:hypothetical protein
MTQIPQRLGDGVFAVDTGHIRPQADASYLIVDGGHAAFVDTGTHRSVANLLAPHLSDPTKLVTASKAVYGDDAFALERELFAHLGRRLQAHGFAGDETAQHALLSGDVTLNAAGLDAWLRRAA